MKITLTQQEKLELFRQVLNKQHKLGLNHIIYQTFEKYISKGYSISQIVRIRAGSGRFQGNRDKLGPRRISQMQLEEARELFYKGVSIKELAHRYNVSDSFFNYYGINLKAKKRQVPNKIKKT